MAQARPARPNLLLTAGVDHGNCDVRRLGGGTIAGGSGRDTLGSGWCGQGRMGIQADVLELRRQILRFEPHADPLPGLRGRVRSDRQQQPVENPPLPKRDKRQIYFVNRPGSIQSAIFIGNVSIPRKDQDYFAIRTADTIYGGSFYSRLTRNIRETKGYTYSPFSSSNTRAKTGSFVAGAFVRNEVTGPTLLEIFYELDRMRVLPVSDEELSAAKEYSNGNFSVELASQFGLAGRINTVYTFDLDKNFINDFRPKIEALTTADIQKAAAKYFDTYRAAIVIVGDWDKVKDQVTPFGDVTMYDADGNVIGK
jgi:hypothetical protein